MSDDVSITTFGDWSKADRLLTGLKDRLRTRLVRATFPLRLRLVESIQEEMRGTRALHPFTAEAKGSTEPLGGRLDDAITSRVLGAGEGLGVWVGYTGEVARLVRIHEYGVTIAVTDRMRGYLHAEGLHLRADTEAIVIPPRPFLRRAARRLRRTVRELVRDELRRA